jgi:DNA-binding transcriptional regulator WhiA
VSDYAFEYQTVLIVNNDLLIEGETVEYEVGKVKLNNDQSSLEISVALEKDLMTKIVFEHLLRNLETMSHEL